MNIKFKNYFKIQLTFYFSCYSIALIDSTILDLNKLRDVITDEVKQTGTVTIKATTIGIIGNSQVIPLVNTCLPLI
jgi:hypothetical protein